MFMGWEIVNYDWVSENKEKIYDFFLTEVAPYKCSDKMTKVFNSFSFNDVYIYTNYHLNKDKRISISLNKNIKDFRTFPEYYIVVEDITPLINYLIRINRDKLLEILDI
jgi:hypothetical protein